MGNLGAKLLVDYITKGVKPSSFKNDSGSIFVTKDNMDTYKASLYR